MKEETRDKLVGLLLTEAENLNLEDYQAGRIVDILENFFDKTVKEISRLKTVISELKADGTAKEDQIEKLRKDLAEAEKRVCYQSCNPKNWRNNVLEKEL